LCAIVALQQSFDAIAIAPIDAQRMEPAIRRARAAGIPLIAIDTPPIEESQALLYVGTDNEAAGRTAGEIMLQLLPEGGLVASSVITLLAVNVCQRLAGFRTVVEQGSIALRPPLEDRLDLQRGIALASQELRERPDINGLLSVCGANWASWFAALESVELTGDVQAVCFDLSADSISGLMSGAVHAVVAQREYVMGYRCVELLARLVSEGAEAVLESLPPDRCVDTGVDMITLERQRNSRTAVAVPLRVGQHILGALQVESGLPNVRGPADLAQFQRIADVVAVMLVNTRLFQQVVDHTRALEQANQSQNQLLRTVMDISSPVVPIARHILVMPLIGTIDEQRAQRFIETLLSEVGAHQARVILIDITGVSVVDTTVANYLLRAAQAVKLLGAEAVLVGITPHVAQTMVSLGVDLNQVVTRANLESGFAYALARTGAQMRYSFG